MTAVLAAIIAGSVALVGYLFNRASERRDHKRQIYAEALRVISEYQQIAFRVARRPASDGQTRAALGDQICDTLVKVAFYRAWIGIESPEVADAYERLIDATHSSSRRNRAAAWSSPLITTDKDAHLVGRFSHDNESEWARYTAAVRRELSWWPRATRRTRTKMTGGGSPPTSANRSTALP